MKKIQQMVLDEVECLNNGDLDGVCKFYTEDVIFGDTSAPDNPTTDLAGFREVMKGFFDGFSDLNVNITRFLFEDGDNVCGAEYILTGTLDGEFAGIGPTGKKMNIPAISIYELRGDLFCKEFIYWDMGVMLDQLK